MYEYIKGILTKITAKYIVVETAGIGYLLHVEIGRASCRERV